MTWLTRPGISRPTPSEIWLTVVMTSFTSFKKGEIPITFILVAIVYLGQQVYDGIFIKDNISNMAHIVGGIVGAVSGYMMRKK